MGMYHFALENITVFSCAQTESVIATDHELSVAVSSKRSGPECVMYIGNCCIRTGYFVLFLPLPRLGSESSDNTVHSCLL